MRRREFLAGTGALLLAGLPRPSFALVADNSGLLLSQSKLNANLIGKLQGGRDNVVVSPASLAGIMAALAVGADDKMQAAIHKMLGLEASAGGVAADLDAVRAKVRGAAMAREQKNAFFAIANMIVIDPQARPNTPVVDKLRKDAAVTVEDLAQPATVARINAWAAEQTRGFIPQVLDGPQRSGGLVGVNALYFKGQWNDHFDAKMTRARPFHTVAGGSSDVPLMARNGSYRFREDGRFAAVDLPYRNDRFALVVATTTDKPATSAEFAPVADWLTGDAFDFGTVDLSLPKFTMRQGAELLDALDALGLKAGHTPTAFAPLAQAPLAISKIAQQTYLKLDEEGTEAAAATTVVAGRMAMRTKTVTVTIDKPFMFALRDRESGLLLLSGYVGSIPKGATVAVR
jgi:serine protease inhibitor